MSNLFRTHKIAGLALAALAATQAWAGTVSTYHVTWDISAVGKKLFERLDSGTQYHFFAQLTNGGGEYLSTTVKLDQFQLGGGMPGPVMQYSGATGDMMSAVTLTDLDFFNGHLQEILKPGKFLNFRMRIEVEDDGGPFPDLFSFGLYLWDDIGPAPIGTVDPFGGDSFARVDLTTGLPQFYTFGSLVSQVDGMTQIPAPEIRLLTSTATPEPASIALIAAGLALGLARRLRTRL